IKLPWPALRYMLPRLTGLLGSSTEVDVWGVPNLEGGSEMVTGLATAMVFAIPLFWLLSITFIPIGQVTARLLERSNDGIKAYSINIVGSLIGVLLYTGLCLIYQPPAVWFLVAGALLLLCFGGALRIRIASVATLGLCAVIVCI